MKVLIVGNYPLADQKSMYYFAQLLVRGLLSQGQEVRLIRPFAFFGRWRPFESTPGKWLSYIDRFILFPFLLVWESHQFDVVHVADHANAPYVLWLGRKPNVVTCHDMLAIRSAFGEIPDNPTGWTGRLYQRLILWGLRKADHVVCVSMQTQREWFRFAPTYSGISSFVPLSLNYNYRPMLSSDLRERLQKLGLGKEPYVLHVGSNNWYKNRLGLVKIYGALRERTPFNGHHLVIAGKPLDNAPRQWLKVNGLLDLLHETGPVDNENLCALYSGADILIFPSLQEGFGWPIIEAQSCGCLVAATKYPPMDEVGGNGAIYFDPNRIEDAANVIVNNWPRRYDIIENGFFNAQRYFTCNMISGYISAYQRILVK